MKKYLMKPIYTLFYLLYFLSCSAFATLTMAVDSTQIGLGDTLTLTLTSDSGEMQAQPDLSPLEKDFSIVTTEHRVNYSLINGITKTSNEWSFTLLPKQAGNFTIPPLTVGKETAAQAINIEVSRTAALNTTPSQKVEPATLDEEVFIQTSAAPKATYINGQIRYTVQIYNRRRLLDVSYTPPKAPNSVIVTLNQSVQNEAMIKGKRYAVETLHYAIFPNQSGKLVIQPPELSGLIYDMLPQPIRIKGKPIEIDVKAAPHHTPHFLPARLITLSETFEPQDQNLSQGATIIRTITIKGDGVLASLLPSLSLKGKGYTLYPSPPEEKNIQTDQGVTGVSTTKITYLFNDAGTWTLPSIDIPWFNTETQQFETAHLPAHTFTVTGTGIPAAQAPIQSNPSVRTQVVYWPYGVIGMLVAVILWLSVMVNKKRKTTEKPTQTSSPSLKQAKQAVKLACENNDSHQVEKALLQWAKLKWPQVTLLSLHQIKEHCQHKALREAIDTLIQTRYSGQKAPWTGTALWKAFDTFSQMKAGNKKKPPSDLPNLNPR